MNITEYVRDGNFPKFGISNYATKSKYTREDYATAEKLLSTEPIGSSIFLEKVTPLSRVIRYPIDGIKDHPKYNEINRVVKDILESEECKELSGMIYVKRCGQIRYPETKILSSVPETLGKRTAYSLYCGDRVVETTSLAYGLGIPYFGTISKLRRDVALLAKLIMDAPWLPKVTWETAIISDIDGFQTNVVLMGRDMAKYYLSSINKDKNWGSSDTNRIPEPANTSTKVVAVEAKNAEVKSVEAKSTLPVYDKKYDIFKSAKGYSTDSIISVVQGRREAVNSIVDSAKIREMSRMDLLDERSSRFSRVSLGSRYYTVLDSYGKKMSSWARSVIDKSSLQYADQYNRSIFWSNMHPSVRVGAFPIDSVEAHPDYGYISGLCNSITRMILEFCEECDVGRLWYLKPYEATDETDELYKSMDKKDSMKYALYCGYSYIGFVRPCFCFEEGSHSELEVLLAKLLYLVSSVPWLDSRLWDCLVLPCSGIVRRSFGKVPLVASESSLRILRSRHWEL